jgi:hypothetical protein
MDVTTLEPCEPDNPLLTLPNAIVTPHIAGDAAERGAKEAARCCLASCLPSQASTVVYSFSCVACMRTHTTEMTGAPHDAI